MGFLFRIEMHQLKILTSIDFGRYIRTYCISVMRKAERTSARKPRVKSVI